MVDWSKASDSELLSAIGKKPRSSTIGQDIRSLGSAVYRGIKKLPHGAYETAKSIGENPGQAAAGIIPGITSIADLPALIGNVALATGEYAAKKYHGNNELESPRIPYFGHQVGSAVSNAIAGEPSTESEQRARFGGEIISPTPPIAKVAGLAGRIPGAGLVKNIISNATPTSPAGSASRNLVQNIGEDIAPGVATKSKASELGLNLTPAEATGNPLLATSESLLGTSKEGAKKIYSHQKNQIAAQKKAIDEFLNQVNPQSEIVNEKVRDLSGSIIDSKKAERLRRASPFYEAADRQVLSDKIFKDIVSKDPIIQHSLEDILKNPVYRKELQGYPANSVKTLDLVKRNLDDKIETALRQGGNNEARILTKSRTSLLDSLDQASPDYKKARAIYSSESPAIKSLEDSVLGKISKMDDEQLKNVTKSIFDPNVTDLKRLNTYRNEIHSEAPEIWKALVRQDMEMKLGKREHAGSGFYDNILKDERVYKQYQIALKDNPEALKKLHAMRDVFKNLTPKRAAKESAAAPSDIIGSENPLNPRNLKKIIDRLSGGHYDNAAIDLIIGNKWDSEFSKLSKESPSNKAIGLAKLLGRIEISKNESSRKSSNPYESVSDEDLLKILSQ